MPSSVLPRFLRLPGLLLSLAVVTGCDLLTGANVQENYRRNLERSRAVWEDSNIRDYTMQMQHICFCANSTPTDAVIVVVRGDSVVSRTRGGTPISPADSVFYPTVLKLFSIIEDSINRKWFDGFQVGYHPVNGSPQYVQGKARIAGTEDQHVWNVVSVVRDQP
jgi:hypothetical protein